jgi:O-acetyl-ADP-ribose deacetylase (regulator of RNase III)
MSHFAFQHDDILNVPADGLICSANPDLNLSGGVGGALLLRYGSQLQEELHGQARLRSPRLIPPGIAVLTTTTGLPWKAIAHAVAINTFYETNAAVIADTYLSALTQLDAVGCRTVTAACIGCGYGRCPDDEFARAIQLLRTKDLPADQIVTFVTRNPDLFDLLR